MVVGVLVALTLLSGCDVQGTVDLRNPHEAVVDVTLTQQGSTPECQGSFAAGAQLPLTERVNDDGTYSCTYRGTAHPERLRRMLVDITFVGEFVAFSINPLGVASSADRIDEELNIEAFDLTVVFPGDVVDTNGTASGRSVRFADGSMITKPLGLRAVALDHPGPSWSLLLGLTTVVCLAALALFGWRTWRRRPQPDVEPIDDQELDDLSAAQTINEQLGPTPPVTQDLSVWAPPSTGDVANDR